MHTLRGEKNTSTPRNDSLPMAELRTTEPTPPEGGWSVWYLTDEDDVGDSTEHGITIRLFLAALTELARERGWTDRLVASDQFFGWVQAHPLVRISPDAYILETPPAPPYPASFQTWRPGHGAPQFALEVVSDEWKKDYDHGPIKYDQLGARELVVFDPLAVTAPYGRRVPLQVFRRGDDGGFPRVASGPGPVHSAELGAWLVVTPGPRLRISRDPAGADLVKTADELLTDQLQKLAAQDRQLQAQDRQIQAHERLIHDQAERIAELEARLRSQTH